MREEEGEGGRVRKEKAEGRREKGGRNMNLDPSK